MHSDTIFQPDVSAIYQRICKSGHTSFQLRAKGLKQHERVIGWSVEREYPPIGGSVRQQYTVKHPTVRVLPGEYVNIKMAFEREDHSQATITARLYYPENLTSSFPTLVEGTDGMFYG